MSKENLSINETAAAEEKPGFTHHCQDCHFLGQYEGFDIYFCESQSLSLVRYGNRPESYWAGWKMPDELLQESRDRTIAWLKQNGRLSE